MATRWWKARTCTLQDGILARLASPPATPSNLAAVVVPTIADRLGARTFIRELTYMKICSGFVSNQLLEEMKKMYTLSFELPLIYLRGHKRVGPQTTLLLRGLSRGLWWM